MLGRWIRTMPWVRAQTPISTRQVQKHDINCLVQLDRDRLGRVIEPSVSSSSSVTYVKRVWRRVCLNEVRSIGLVLGILRN